MMEDHGFTWDDWQTPDRMAKARPAAPTSAVVYVWTRTSDALPYMRAVQTAVEAAPSGDTLYLDMGSR